MALLIVCNESFSRSLDIVGSSQQCCRGGALWHHKGRHYYEDVSASQSGMVEGDVMKIKE